MRFFWTNELLEKRRRYGHYTLTCKNRMTFLNRRLKFICLFLILVMLVSVGRASSVFAASDNKTGETTSTDVSSVAATAGISLPVSADSSSVEEAYKLLKDTVQAVTAAVNDVNVRDDIRDVKTGESWVDRDSYESIVDEISKCWDEIEAYSSKTAAQLDSQTMELVKAYNGDDGFWNNVYTAYDILTVLVDGSNSIDEISIADDARMFDSASSNVSDVIKNSPSGSVVYLIDSDNDKSYDVAEVWELHAFIYAGAEENSDGTLSLEDTDYKNVEAANVDAALDAGDWAVAWVNGSSVFVERAVQVLGILGQSQKDSDSSVQIDEDVFYMDGEVFEALTGSDAGAIPEANQAYVYIKFMEYFGIAPGNETTMWGVELTEGNTAALGFISGDMAEEYLSQAIEVIKTALNSVVVYSSVPEISQGIDKNWVTEEEFNVLKTAQTAAREVLSQSDDPYEMDAAMYGLYQAVESATDVMSPGNYGHGDITDNEETADEAEEKDRTHILKTVEVVLIVIFAIVAALVIATAVYVIILTKRGRNSHLYYDKPAKEDDRDINQNE